MSKQSHIYLADLLLVYNGTNRNLLKWSDSLDMICTPNQQPLTEVLVDTLVLLLHQHEPYFRHGWLEPVIPKILHCEWEYVRKILYLI